LAAALVTGQSPATAPGGFAPIAPATQPAAQVLTPPDNFEEVPLGHAFESQSAGVLFKPPVDCKLVDTISSKYIAEWTDPSRDWTLKLGKMVLDHPTPLVSGKDNFGTQVEGILDKTVRNLQAQLPGSVVLKQDVSNTGGGGRFDPKHPEWRDNVGLIAIRYDSKGASRLSQQAIIQATDGIYYLLTLTSPGAKPGQAESVVDSAERLAAETFNRMVDSVRLLDRTAIKTEQDNRLFQTRAAFVNWTPAKLHSILLSEQWVRIIKNGKDIGYSYITEDVAGGIPRPLTRKQLDEGKKELDLARALTGDGVLIGVRMRMLSEGTRSDKTKGTLQTDSASWFFVSADKKHEDFSRVVVTDDHISPKKGYIQEFGVSERRVRRFFEKPVDDPKTGVIRAPGEVIPVMKEDWQLDVTQTSNVGMADPIARKLPPWYIPQALSHLLPRLLPLQRPQKYLFATYVSDAREVVMRYIDVLPDQDVLFNGRVVRAVTIEDRLGLEGSITDHYMTIDGIYIGTENKDQKLVMLPTDSGTLQHIWQDADLTHPGAVSRPGPANASLPDSASQADVFKPGNR
jgi:hypothetical protein